MSVSPIPDGLHTLTPYLTVHDAAGAIEWYTQALDAKVTFLLRGPGGKVVHAQLKIGDSVLMLSDEMPGSSVRSPHSAGFMTAGITMYVPDVDAVFNRAITAGAKVKMPVADMFWGDRTGAFIDPFGHGWSVNSRKEQLTQAQIEERARALYSNMTKQAGG